MSFSERRLSLGEQSFLNNLEERATLPSGIRAVKQQAGESHVTAEAIGSGSAALVG